MVTSFCMVSSIVSLPSSRLESRNDVWRVRSHVGLWWNAKYGNREGTGRPDDHSNRLFLQTLFMWHRKKVLPCLNLVISGVCIVWVCLSHKQPDFILIDTGVRWGGLLLLVGQLFPESHSGFKNEIPSFLFPGGQAMGLRPRLCHMDTPIQSLECAVIDTKTKGGEESCTAVMWCPVQRALTAYKWFLNCHLV